MTGAIDGKEKIAGLVLIVLGLGIAYTGYEISGSFTNQVGEVEIVSKAAQA